MATFLDGTLGAGGHSAAIAAQHPELRTLVGVDMDPAAHAVSRARLKGLTSASGEPVDVRQVQVRAWSVIWPLGAAASRRDAWQSAAAAQGNFRALKEVVQRELGGAGTVDGILLDLGMSSMQACSHAARRSFPAGLHGNSRDTRAPCCRDICGCRLQCEPCAGHEGTPRDGRHDSVGCCLRRWTRQSAGSATRGTGPWTCAWGPRCDVMPRVFQ